MDYSKTKVEVGQTWVSNNSGARYTICRVDYVKKYAWYSNTKDGSEGEFGDLTEEGYAGWWAGDWRLEAEVVPSSSVPSNAVVVNDNDYECQCGRFCNSKSEKKCWFCEAPIRKG